MARRFLKLFGGYDYVVAPSGSCVSMVVSMVRNHYDELLAGQPDFERLRR